jgi:hypothetical protein
MNYLTHRRGRNREFYGILAPMPLASVSDIQNNISSLQSLIKAFDCGRALHSP